MLYPIKLRCSRLKSVRAFVAASLASLFLEQPALAERRCDRNICLELPRGSEFESKAVIDFAVTNISIPEIGKFSYYKGGHPNFPACSTCATDRASHQFDRSPRTFFMMSYAGKYVGERLMSREGIHGGMTYVHLMYEVDTEAQHKAMWDIMVSARWNDVAPTPQPRP